MPYPSKSGQFFARRGILDRLKSYYETFRVTARERRDIQKIELNSLKPVLPLSGSDMPLVFITHNDMTLLPSLLRYYRSLGVTRFICVDDVSSDGTREFLLQQPDVDVWTSPIRFGDARRGRRWREKLFAIYGLDRWYINIDSDEFLVYDSCFEKPLSALVAVLERSGIKRLPAPMLDMYPGPDAIMEGGQNEMPWHFSNHFDGSHYQLRVEKRGISIKGGPRRRRFGEENELIKYPLIYWDKECFFGSSLHRPLPYDRNFPPIWGNLLHFKFFTNYKDKIAEAVSERQHYNGSVHYQAMMKELDLEGEINLVEEMSVKYVDPEQLVELGFMTSIDY